MMGSNNKTQKTYSYHSKNHTQSTKNRSIGKSRNYLTYTPKAGKIEI